MILQAPSETQTPSWGSFEVKRDKGDKAESTPAAEPPTFKGQGQFQVNCNDFLVSETRPVLAASAPDGLPPCAQLMQSSLATSRSKPVRHLQIEPSCVIISPDCRSTQI